MRKIFLFLLFTVVSFSVFSQAWTVYKKADGLPDDNVIGVAIDKQGNKWVGCSTGIYSFDGTKWTSHSPESPLWVYIPVIVFDAQNNLWGGSPQGAASFANGTWKFITEKDGLPGSGVTSIAVDAQGNKWFGTNGGIAKFDGTKWTVYTTKDGLINDEVNTVAIDSKGKLWIGTENGISVFDGTTWTSYTTEKGLINNKVTSIAADEKGNVWVGTSNGLSQFDGTTWNNFTKKNGLISNMIKCVACDNKGYVWIGTTFNGISRFDGKNWRSFTTTNGLINNNIGAIAIDAQGYKWIATLGGLVKLDDSNMPDPAASAAPVSKLPKNRVLILRPDSTQGKDAFVSSLTPDANKGKASYMSASSQVQDGKININRGLVEFNIPALPKGSVIDSARLSIYFDQASKFKQMGNNVLCIQQIIGDWDEKTVNWNNQPKTSETNQVVLPKTVFENQDYRNVDVTEMVKDMVANREESHGFMIKLQDEKPMRRVYFATSDNANKSFHPKLVIYYTVDSK